MPKQTWTKVQFLQQIKRTAWKLQYQAKKQYRREMFLDDHKEVPYHDSIDSQLFVEELLNSLPERERFIIQRVVIEGRTEREVAQELRISRSRLHACKVQGLQRLHKKIVFA
ncbi:MULTISPECIES: sigma factor-like helix-turn-helix DNA-binding protein [Brevibacillus]|jgi:DNA-directed RNA polymerase specialized sigma subunit|uniref:sigma factor-like helix-turn-helix DNA-binding protein n=1 Tax=Brevibacillus TaxID=55080 RepID=UPI000469A768|nr:sigma factor-like helix-turn-helix DNA-binding protein [Brevibacillus borstelensis]MBE5396253.1 sigma-70 family RNA polymerase sigma factor [Brevibacillus borstelensis]MCC0565753.1 sigma-70 family RNA polymerase sigma factor [Brevibacillus borstelensis]MCM3473564.1 sigma-70 family RNA polymerase sigma factor [Brevibacillus borstelensis]MCM3560357.1 sigma-70 family RNA polymerase sigma factor [Brevibacillus borstelensis]MCM3592883.1 sigma-70 family RNA polymerase sigma factor [Brevibacillus 